MRRIAIWLVGMTLGLYGFGQQLPLHSINLDFISDYNPAAVNNAFLLLGRNVNTVSIFHRDQWANKITEGDPRTFGGNADFWIKRRHKVGASFVSDQAGAINNNQASFRWSLDLFNSGNSPLKNDDGERDRGSLHLGIGTHYRYYHLALSKIDPSDLSDPLLQENNIVDNQFFTASAGFWGHFDLIEKERKITLFGGASFHQISFRSIDNLQVLEQVSHFYFHPGFIFEVSKKPKGKSTDHFLELSSLVQIIPGAPTNTNISLRHHLCFNGAKNNIINYGFGYVKNSLQAAFFWFFRGKYGGGLSIDLFDRYTTVTSGPTMEARIFITL